MKFRKNESTQFFELYICFNGFCQNPHKKNILIVGTIISDNSFLNGTDMWLKTLSSFNKVSDKSDVLVSMEIIMKIFCEYYNIQGACNKYYNVSLCFSLRK